MQEAGGRGARREANGEAGRGHRAGALTTHNSIRPCALGSLRLQFRPAANHLGPMPLHAVPQPGRRQPTAHAANTDYPHTHDGPDHLGLMPVRALLQNPLFVGHGPRPDTLGVPLHVSPRPPPWRIPMENPYCGCKPTPCSQ